MTGFEINFNTGVNDKVTKHPLFLKYNMTPFTNIVANDVKADLNAILPTQASMPIIAYLSTLLRVKALLA
jgi:hypothetical protein